MILLGTPNSEKFSPPRTRTDSNSPGAAVDISQVEQSDGIRGRCCADPRPRPVFSCVTGVYFMPVTALQSLNNHSTSALHKPYITADYFLRNYHLVSPHAILPFWTYLLRPLSVVYASTYRLTTDRNDGHPLSPSITVGPIKLPAFTAGLRLPRRLALLRSSN